MSNTEFSVQNLRRKYYREDVIKFYFQTQPEIHVIFHKIQDSIFKLNLKYILSSTKGIAKGFTGLKRFVLIKPTKSNQEVRTVFDESVDVVWI